MRARAARLALAMVVATSVAAAEEAPPPQPPPRHTAASVAGAPPPGDAANLAHGPERRGEWLLWIPRVLFFPLRVVVEIVDFPIRRGLRAIDTYDLEPRIRSILFNEEETAGLFPVIYFETSFGFDAGARLFLRDLGDTRFEITGVASFGGRYRQAYSLALSSRDTWRHLGFDVGFDGIVRPKDQFWGIGNADEAAEPPPVPIDPLDAPLTQSRYRQRIIRGILSGRAWLNRYLGGRLSLVVVDRMFQASDEGSGEPIDQVFRTPDLTDFLEGSRHLHLEAELALDTRRPSTYWIGPSTPSTGMLVSVFGGYAIPLAADSSGFGHYGFDLQRYVYLAEGPRVLALRLLLDGVIGGYGDIPFNDLPSLGGARLLRGYDSGHFHDRLRGLASAEYQFDLSNRWLSGFLFADAGRVYSGLDALSFDDLRLGFGGGFELHTRTSFLGRVTLASSIDGGFFATLSFDPVYDFKARVGKR